MSANIGWLFYRDYFEDLKDGDEPDFTRKSDELKSRMMPEDVDLPTLGTAQFHAETTYPGLLIGTGYQHMTGGEGEFKIGFYFDYTSGLPVIPGSSVKGLLRSVFPYHRENLGDHFRKSRLGYIRALLHGIIGKEKEVTDDQIKALELEIFEGVYKSQEGAKNLAYQRDIFHDAVIAEYSQGRQLLATDFITPHHHDPLKNPTPLMLLKVAPGVIFRFQFSLQGSSVIPELTADKKLALFSQIIMDQGVGAKTNVGYGQLDEVDVEALEREQRLLDLEALKPAYEADVRQFVSDHSEVMEALEFHKGKVIEYEAVISYENEMFFLFEVQGVKVYQARKDVMDKIEDQVIKRSKRERKVGYDELKEGEPVRLQLKALNADTINFNVYPIWK